MLNTPADGGVIRLDTCPLSSLNRAQVDAPAHADSNAAGALVKTTVAPATGVPSGAITCTLTGLAASVPAGVGGFDPIAKCSRSPAPAPYVNTSVSTVDPR